MAYPSVFDPATPLGSNDARFLDDAVRLFKSQLLVRMESIFDDFDADPLVLKANSVGSSQITALAVGTSELNAEAVTIAKIDGAITDVITQAFTKTVAVTFSLAAGASVVVDTGAWAGPSDLAMVGVAYTSGTIPTLEVFFTAWIQGNHLHWAAHNFGGVLAAVTAEDVKFWAIDFLVP